jgi:hypothetical protein
VTTDERERHGEPVSPCENVERLRAAVDGRDWKGLHDLCHPEARVVLPISEGVALPPSDLVSALRSATEESTYAAYLYHVEEIDENAACVVGSFHSFTKGAVDATPACWVVTFVDGLLYREALFGSITEARRAYTELGVELGIPATEPVLPEAV